jgi:hypothetical protein
VLTLGFCSLSVYLFVNPPPKKTTTTAVDQSKSENNAKTNGGQSPAVAGAKNVTVNYGQTPTKDKPAKQRK